MPDNRDFRVRAYLYFTNEGVATGLYNHAHNLMSQAVDINFGQLNTELRKCELDNHWYVIYDLDFPPGKQGIARGLYTRTENVAKKDATSAPGEEKGFVSLENCGHRLKQPCTPIERYDVE